MIGRWRPSAAESYERNLKANVTRCQAVIAHFIKKNLGNTDPFDEVTVIQLVEQKMKNSGFSQTECDEQMLRLMSFLPLGDQATECVKPSWTTTGPVVFVEEGGVKEEPEETNAMASLAELSSDGLENDEQLPGVTPLEKVAGLYIVSVVGRSKTKTLHKIGECHRQPGVHYKSFEVWGEEVPDKALYHKACKQCFRRGVAAASNSPESDSSGEVSSSEMTDSDGQSIEHDLL